MVVRHIQVRQFALGVLMSWAPTVRFVAAHRAALEHRRDGLLLPGIARDGDSQVRQEHRCGQIGVVAALDARIIENDRLPR